MKRYISKILALMGVGVVCTACYGSPYMDYDPNFDVEGGVTDQAGNPIEGIRIAVTTPRNSVYGLTDRDGYYHLDGYVESNHSVLLLEFDDIDGEANGGDFASTVVEVDMTARIAPPVVMTLKQ